MFGKKIFFLYPHSVIQDRLIFELISNEYEVYFLKDHKKAKDLFITYPDSICFINIDEGLTESEWENYIHDLMENPQTKNIKIGILSYNNNESLKEKYLMEIMVPCGFILLKMGIPESTKIILKVLEVNEAKGRRKYVRVNCKNCNNVSVKLNIEGKEFKGEIRDISSVGMSFYLPDYTLQKNTILTNIQLSLRGIIITLGGVVIGNRADNKHLYIVLYHPKLDSKSKEKIHRYIMSTLQKLIEQS